MVCLWPAIAARVLAVTHGSISWQIGAWELAAEIQAGLRSGVAELVFCLGEIGHSCFRIWRNIQGETGRRCEGRQDRNCSELHEAMTRAETAMAMSLETP